MRHFSTFPGAHARPTPARAFPGPTALGSMMKTVIVTLLATILAWRPSIAMRLRRARAAAVAYLLEGLSHAHLGRFRYCHTFRRYW